MSRIWWLAMLLVPCIVLAADRPEALAQVTVNDGVYRLHSEVLIEQAPAQVRRVLSDYARLPRINSGITAVRLLGFTAAGEQRMAVEAASCVALFCRTYHWVQAVRNLADGSILAIIEPRDSDFQSDFRAGLTRYRFLPHDGCTRLVFEAELDPVFWVPPLLGPWLIERKLIAEALETARSIESYLPTPPVRNCQPLRDE